MTALPWNGGKILQKKVLQDWLQEVNELDFCSVPNLMTRLRVLGVKVPSMNVLMKGWWLHVILLIL